MNLFGFRESTAIFNHLCETFPDENCVLASREILAEVTNEATICVVIIVRTTLVSLNAPP